MEHRLVRGFVVGSIVLGGVVGAIAEGAAPPLLPDVAPPGVWTLQEVDGSSDPWPDATVQLGVADDGVTLLVDSGCDRFLAVVSFDGGRPVLETRARSDLRCEGDRAAAEAIVAPVVADVEAIDVLAGRLVIRGAGRVLAFAPEAPPTPAGVPGAPPVASSDRLDPTRFDAVVDASASSGAAWVQDPLWVALLFVDAGSTRRTTIVRDEGSDDATATVRLWFDGLLDDAIRARWFEVHLERDDDAVWRVASARRAVVCGRPGMADEAVAGRCP